GRGIRVLPGSERPHLHARRQQLRPADDSVEEIEIEGRDRSLDFFQRRLDRPVEVEPSFLSRMLDLPFQLLEDLLTGPLPFGRARLQHDFADPRWEPGKDRLQLTYDRLEQGDPFAQRKINVRFDRAPVVEIDHADDAMLLTDPINAPDPLLHPHGVPGQIVVHESTTELEV